MLLRKRVDQFLIHAIRRPQVKLALRLIEHEDRAGFGAGELHSLGDNGRKHGLQIERGIDRLADLAERAQLLDQLT